MMMYQDAEKIAKKIEEAPDSSYEIGVFIGSYLPYVIFVIIAYFIYRMAKNRKDLKD
ncbi:hypothetical protein N9L20_04490 [Flavobacteriaceae bacterium]|nr:hypothetical protein [Flavobacteriaceae bacterium]